MVPLPSHRCALKYPDPIRRFWKSETVRLLRMAVSQQARAKFRQVEQVRLVDPKQDDHRYRNPLDLRRTDTPRMRVLVIGSCMAQAYFDYIADEQWLERDLIYADYLKELPDQPPRPIEDYDLQLINPTFRAIVPEYGYFTIPPDDVAGHATFFDQCCQRLDRMLDVMLRWNSERQLLSFVTNFLTPQQNSLGKLMPRYDLRNPVHFVERLNQHLAAHIAGRPNVHLLDVDGIAATIGRKHMQDDHLWHLSHNGFIGDWDHEMDSGRIERTRPISHYHRQKVSTFFKAVWAEVEASVRILRQIDMVKLVAIDLDDTLWRGVMAEDGLRHAEPLEGWPLGFAEALVTLRKRGILLAIISKNDADRIEAIWDRVFGPILPLSAFAIRKINWRPKAENMAEVLREASILPRNVVFIDDNPVERAAMAAAYPDIRILGEHPYLMRRILLWAPETQVAAITDESGRRSEMIEAQIAREEERQSMSRARFLVELDLSVRPALVGSVEDPGFARAMELVNKSNQFNSSGERWTLDAFAALFARGGTLATFAVADRFTRYGVVAVAIIEGACIRQFVMSCRVIGLEVEAAAIGWTIGTIRAGGMAPVTARRIETADNGLTRDLYARMGFTAGDDLWTLDGPAPDLPGHVRIEAAAR